LDWKAFVADTLEGYALKPRVIGDEYTDAYSVDIVRVAPNGFSASHIDQARHAFFILEGEGRVTIGTETHIVYPGSVVKIPPGIPHAVNNDGAYVLVFLAIYDPPRKRS
jgi:mannose-6-phosphate isomerase-like protein (cupin superfamily)